MTFNLKNSSWTVPVNMEIRKAGINVKNAATGSATLSPDGRCLFFSRSGDIYWVSTKIIGDMKKEVFNTRIINY